MANGKWWHIRCFIRRIFQLLVSFCKMRAMQKWFIRQFAPILIRFVHRKEKSAHTYDTRPKLHSQVLSNMLELLGSRFHLSLMLRTQSTKHVPNFSFFFCKGNMRKGKKLCFNYEFINNKIGSFDWHRNWNVFTTTTASSLASSSVDTGTVMGIAN